ncbi:hypothetical protein NCAS_0F02900 [Naumovozyma castellii]|uniref:Uncharacterized protein n=1 Tax=Naumovozyma castellii TaxID=27288 RepID=G0VH03_NAUCA|nr:hypothetical protein NCAS_0F02900 [Naumovozyma castellii CBS 4309]CCC70774.1 hypothetical protein NCAS_0F02900 [Naumovozyma castellii CBS 4309]
MHNPYSIYEHHSPKSKKTTRKNIRRLVAIETTSFTEEEQNQEVNMSQALKRSISSNAVNNLKRRPSFSGLHRTLSQTSCYSTGSAMSANLRNESFNEFMYFLNGEEYYNKANYLWENLPKETKDVFVARVSTKKRNLNKEDMTYNDIKDLFQGQTAPTKGSFMQYRKKISPYFRQESPGMPESTISKIIGQLYNNELTEKDRKRLKREAEQFYNNETQHRLKEAKKYINKSNKSSCDDPFLEQMELWKGRKELADKIKELNTLMTKLEVPSHAVKSSGVPTPQNKQSLTPIPVEKSTFKKKNTTTSGTTIKVKVKENNKSTTFAASITNQSKKLMKKFKKKKRPAALNLYRNPEDKD